MKILVCVTEVPAAATGAVIAEGGRGLSFPEGTVFVMNPLDAHALEEALQIREAMGEGIIEVVAAGGERTEPVLFRALEMGADRAFCLRGEGNLFSPLKIAGVIAEWARTREYDLILTGVMSENGMSGAVGPLIGALLDLPAAVSVVHTDHQISGDSITVTSEHEGGLLQRVSLPLPALLTIQSGINRPRYPSLSNKLRAREEKIEVQNFSFILSEGGDEFSFRREERAPEAEFLTGSSEEKAVALLKILRRESLLR